MESLSIVIPAYNEEHRLPKTLQVLRQYLAKLPLGTAVDEVLVVNDGSLDKTADCVHGLQAEWPLLRLISYSENKGKGAAVHEGLRQARASWVLVADADMATPWEELEKLYPFISENDLIMGSRGLPQSDIVIRQHWIRQSMGKTFNKILKLFVGLPFHDTQCGFKLIKNDPFFRENILPRLRVERFSWDVELILFLLKYKKKILEVPIRWQHQEESHVHIVRDSLEMLWAVWKLRRRIRFE